MPTYQDYLKQIAELEILARAAREAEIVEARRQVQQLVHQFGLKLTDLNALPAKPKKAKPAGAKAKYLNPESGATWSGRGRPPFWLSGKNKEDFLIK